MAKKKKLLKKSFPSFLVLFFLLLITIFLAYQVAFAGRIYPGVKIAGIPVGNKTPLEAKAVLSATTSSRPEKILLTLPGKTWEINLQEINLSYQEEITLSQAYQIGRHPHFFKAWQEKKTAWVKGINLGLEYDYNQEILEKTIEKIAENLFVPAVNPQIKVLEKRLAGPGTRIMIEPGQNGQELNRQKLLNMLAQSFSQANFAPINLPLLKTSPALSEEEAKKLKEEAAGFLEKSLELTLDGKSMSLLPDKELLGFLSPFGGFDREKIEEFVENLTTSVNRPAQNASFQFVAGRVTVFKPATEGVLLKKEETVEAVLQKLKLLKDNPQEKEILPLVLAKIEPKIKTEDANNLGIKELLGKGESYFRGSIPSRIHNMTLASSRFHGILIGPGEIFSFNETLGDVSITTGYKEAYIIKEGRTLLGDGGGVCQVSTTLFRAVLAAGLPVVERQAHAYRVGYYEQGFPPGLDATVFAPSPDFKFQNNTPTHILIQTWVDKTRNLLTFSLYGESDGRVATIAKPRIWDQVLPPPDLYQDDSTLPAGAVKQVDWSAWGAKVAFDWKVERNGEILEERTFYSVYKPWQAIFLRGTGGQ